MTVTKDFVDGMFDVMKEMYENKIVLTIGTRHYSLSPGWRLIYNKSKQSAGMCRTDKVILISSVYINSVSVTSKDVIDTMLHEFAHAIAGVCNGHNLIWTTVAQNMGCSATVNCKIFAPHKYKLICPKGCYHLRHQLVKRVYTDRTKGYATCPKHVYTPVLVSRIYDNTHIKSYSRIEDLQVIFQEFRNEQITIDEVNPSFI